MEWHHHYEATTTWKPPRWPPRQPPAARSMAPSTTAQVVPLQTCNGPKPYAMSIQDPRHAKPRVPHAMSAPSPRQTRPAAAQIQLKLNALSSLRPSLAAHFRGPACFRLAAHARGQAACTPAKQPTIPWPSLLSRPSSLLPCSPACSHDLAYFCSPAFSGGSAQVPVPKPISTIRRLPARSTAQGGSIAPKRSSLFQMANSTCLPTSHRVDKHSRAQQTTLLNHGLPTQRDPNVGPDELSRTIWTYHRADGEHFDHTFFSDLTLPDSNLAPEIASTTIFTAQGGACIPWLSSSNPNE